MKNFFESKINKNNPFIDHTEKKGDKGKKMTEELNSQEIQEENNTQEEEKKEEIQTPQTPEEENNPENNELEKTKAELETLNNQYIRLAADFDNYRKRQVQEREALLKYGAQECMKKIIEVVDNFDRAQQAIEKIDDIEKMKESFHVLNKQLMDSLTKLGLEQIKSVGEKFDPNLHEAVMQTQTEEYPEETIINELQKGYKLGDKVLRPAMVAVAVK